MPLISTLAAACARAWGWGYSVGGAPLLADFLVIAGGDGDWCA